MSAKQAARHAYFLKNPESARGKPQYATLPVSANAHTNGSGPTEKRARKNPQPQGGRPFQNAGPILRAARNIRFLIYASPKRRQGRFIGAWNKSLPNSIYKPPPSLRSLARPVLSAQFVSARPPFPIGADGKKRICKKLYLRIKALNARVKNAKSGGPQPDRRNFQFSDAAYNTACAAARRATGTRGGEQLT